MPPRIGNCVTFIRYDGIEAVVSCQDRNSPRMMRMSNKDYFVVFFTSADLLRDPAHKCVRRYVLCADSGEADALNVRSIY